MVDPNNLPSNTLSASKAPSAVKKHTTLIYTHIEMLMQKIFIYNIYLYLSVEIQSLWEQSWKEVRRRLGKRF